MDELWKEHAKSKKPVIKHHMLYHIFAGGCWERLRQEEKGGQRMRWLGGIINSVDMSFEQILGNAEGQGSLTCCSPRGRKESDTTEWPNNNMATDASIPTGRIPRTEEPGGLPSMVMQRAGHDWSNWACMSMHTTYYMIPYIWNFQRVG